MAYPIHKDDETHLATDGEAMKEFARNVGVERSDTAWLLTSYDTWERNPFYTGPEVRHPEGRHVGNGHHVWRGAVGQDDGLALRVVTGDDSSDRLEHSLSSARPSGGRCRGRVSGGR